MKDNYFKELNSINVSDKIEKKNNLSYLSWAYAWGELKKAYPKATSKVYETEQGCIYWSDGNTAWVKVSITVNEIEHIEYLPVMNYSNKSMKISEVTSVDVNKTIQRATTKAIARHGLGLYIYAGEDLPEATHNESEGKLQQEGDKTTTGIPAIDKSTDADSLKATAPSTSEQKNEIIKLAKLKGFNLNEICSSYKCSSLPKMKFGDAVKAIEKLRLKKDVN